MKKNRSSKNWIKKQHGDKFFKKSKILGYKSRSAFKLIELNEKYRFFKRNTNLLDLGSSPGGWAQVASENISFGKIVSVDLKKMDIIGNIEFYQGNFLDDNIKKKIMYAFPSKIDVITSDMAENTTGSRDLDCIRTNILCSEVINLASHMLVKNGTLISKLFMGYDFEEVKNLANAKFKSVNFFKPESSRSVSKETYIHCKTLKSL